MFASDEYDFVPLGATSWAAVAKPGRGASSNAGIVELGRATLVFDTSMTPKAASDLRSAARVLTGKEPLEVANSHWHFGHTLGNRVLGGATIRATIETHEILARETRHLAEQVGGPGWTQRVHALRTRRDGESRPGFREELEAEIAAGVDLRDGQAQLAPRLPDEVFRDRYVYPGGNDVMLVAGAGHSESDTIAFVPRDDVMFTGDLVVTRTHPDLRFGDPARWQLALERIVAAHPRHLVPGHGPPAEVGACREVAEYLRRVQELAAGPGPVGLPEEYADWARPSLFAQNVASLRARGRAPRPPA